MALRLFRDRQCHFPAKLLLGRLHKNLELCGDGKFKDPHHQRFIILELSKSHRGDAPTNRSHDELRTLAFFYCIIELGLTDCTEMNSGSAQGPYYTYVWSPELLFGPFNSSGAPALRRAVDGLRYDAR
ncbi:hypothetical protein M413DRAFT_285889 [Hebeloma cylindrosporum]|uniref:Uncharacterized protein n=1 Tax=Hebeloma cylindrosporum TaxID=76867 RepID=A0A0C3BX65_HEBCY|nr:hypothetical protein M413DRAFT_285889 [Hebeloma cylindrosporum h7]